MSQPTIQVRDLWKRYGQRAAVAGLSFELRPGVMLGLLGHNGAGKTTTIRILLDIIRADSGVAHVFGAPINELSKNRVGYLPEERGVYMKMKVVEYLIFSGVLRHVAMGEARRRAVGWLERFELADRQQSLISELSKGNQQKIQFIATLLHEPELLILDEPFSGLDPVNRHLFEEIVLEKHREGRAVIFSTHVLEQAERLLDEVIMLKNGEAVVQGTLAEVKGQFSRQWLEVRGRGVEEALATMDGLEVAGRLGNGTLRVRIGEDTDVQAILRGLVAAGAAIDVFHRAEPSLNDIFLERVGGIDMGLVEKAGVSGGEA